MSRDGKCMEGMKITDFFYFIFFFFGSVAGEGQWHKQDSQTSIWAGYNVNFV